MNRLQCTTADHSNVIKRVGWIGFCAKFSSRVRVAQERAASAQCCRLQCFNGDAGGDASGGDGGGTLRRSRDTPEKAKKNFP
ncbi:unnamed protein product [Cylicostephanus goldi]|uniref:Uncharacterized protein n=1 Tax=Cylicostephanus goldi TaxID=71465 RepID=A0A3P7MCB4_CYLGO|nr:unnamed protein product [Cylicostephanus goldi]